MYLLGIRIKNFRAIRMTSISFDDGTVLIGENDCGIAIPPDSPVAFADAIIQLKESVSAGPTIGLPSGA